MPSFMGNPVTQRGGSGAGRGDDPHGVTMPKWQTDQHAVAHADGFIGPRIGEVYGDGRKSGQAGRAPTLQGGQQISPASQPLGHNYNGNMGTADRMAHLDNVLPGSDVRMLQHRATGNIVEQWKGHQGTPSVNVFGTTASGSAMRPHDDVNMTPRGGAIDTSSDDYTDISDVVRSTQTYKQGRK